MMIKNPVFAAAITSICLLLYYLLFHLDAGGDIILAMFLASPLLLIWMVLTILKDKKYTSGELTEEEEWGYGDR